MFIVSSGSLSFDFKVFKDFNTSEYFGSLWANILIFSKLSFEFLKYRHNKTNFVSDVRSLKLIVFDVLFNKFAILKIYFLFVIL